MTKSEVIIVTGCSSGIGFELAKKLVKSEHRCVLTCRSESLEAFKKNLGPIDAERILIRPLDVTKEAERRALMEEVSWRFQQIDVLINNAGIAYRSVVEHMSDDEESHQMNVNYFGPMALVRLVLPHMRRAGSGRIINVSSVSGMMAMPTMSSYSASKFALEGAMESLWYELKPWNIKVSVIQPGFIRSESFKNVYYSRQASTCDLKDDAYCRYYATMEPFVEKLMSSSWTSAADIAEKILRVMRASHPALRIPGTLDAQIFYWLRRVLPRRFYHHLLYWSLPKQTRKHSKPSSHRSRSHSNDDAI